MSKRTRGHVTCEVNPLFSCVGLCTLSNFTIILRVINPVLSLPECQKSNYFAVASRHYKVCRIPLLSIPPLRAASQLSFKKILA